MKRRQRPTRSVRKPRMKGVAQRRKAAKQYLSSAAHADCDAISSHPSRQLSPTAPYGVHHEVPSSAVVFAQTRSRSRNSWCVAGPHQNPDTSARAPRRCELACTRVYARVDGGRESGV
eukprot:166369-Rhodomonas_salina.1